MKVCKKCNNEVTESVVSGYSYSCDSCDEDLFAFETESVIKDKEINVYNSHYRCPVTLIIDGNEHITINPKQDVHIKVNGWFGSDNFKLEETQGNNWKEQYQGQYNQNLILRLEH